MFRRKHAKKPSEPTSKFKDDKSKYEGKEKALGDDPANSPAKYGLEVLYEPEQPSDAIVDIVFVHGLTGDRRTTWTSSSGTLWPKHLLPQWIPEARVMTYGYDADIVHFFRTTGTNNLRKHASGLLFDLNVERRDSGCSSRPLIFVAHSLGGLIVKQTLLMSMNPHKDYKHFASVVNSTTGIAFMGTPHDGADFARWVTAIARISKTLWNTNSEVISMLRPDSSILAGLREDFERMLDSRSDDPQRRISVLCFFEELPTNNLVDVIVSKSSATMPPHPELSLHATHTEMVRFDSTNDNNFRRVAGILLNWVVVNYPQGASGGGSEHHASGRRPGFLAELPESPPARLFVPVMPPESPLPEPVPRASMGGSYTRPVAPPRSPSIPVTSPIQSPVPPMSDYHKYGGTIYQNHNGIQNIGTVTIHGSQSTSSHGYRP